jgi:hypothetical protein
MERNDLSRALVAFDQDSTLVAVVELSLNDWLVAGFVAGDTGKRLKKLVADPERLLKQLLGWRDAAVKAGRAIARIAVAFEAGRDGFWLARWLRARGIEAHVIHASSIPMPRQHRRAKTDRLDTETLMRAFLGWLRGEARHCQMVAIPTLAEEDARRPTRERSASAISTSSWSRRSRALPTCAREKKPHTRVGRGGYRRSNCGEASVPPCPRGRVVPRGHRGTRSMPKASCLGRLCPHNRSKSIGSCCNSPRDVRSSARHSNPRSRNSRRNASGMSRAPGAARSRSRGASFASRYRQPWNAR